MRELIRWIFSPFVLIGALVIALLLLAVTLGLAWFSRPDSPVISPSTAVVNVISAPTQTLPAPPTVAPLNTPTPTGSPSSQPIPPAPLPGVIQIEAYVQITGTGGDGLRLRTDPGLNAEVRLLGAEAEVFQVKDGPKDVDGYTWWYLVGPYDSSRRGWAVSNFLQIVQAP